MFTARHSAKKELVDSLNLPEKCIKCPLVEACKVSYADIKSIADQMADLGHITGALIDLIQRDIPGVKRPPVDIEALKEQQRSFENPPAILSSYIAPWDAAQEHCEGRKFDPKAILNKPMQCTNTQVEAIRQEMWPSLPNQGWYFAQRPEELRLRIDSQQP